MSGGPAGRLVALEGVDGCGKSTQARRLADALGAVLTHEPGATHLGAALRRLLLDPGQPSVATRAEALLMAADRAQHVDEVIRPVLAGGRWVVTDRYTASTFAYQGAGRGLSPGSLAAVTAFATDGLSADLNVLLDVSPDVARSRLGGRDRFERLGPGFFERVREGYLRLAADDPVHWAVIDADRPLDAVSADVATAVASRLGSPPKIPTAGPAR